MKKKMPKKKNKRGRPPKKGHRGRPPKKKKRGRPPIAKARVEKKKRNPKSNIPFPVLESPVLEKILVSSVENKEEPIHKTRIRVIGIGGGGGAIVSEIANRIRKADFYIANTDYRSLSEPIKKVKKFQFGINTTKGLGTGMNSQLGEAAALEEEEKIKKIVENQDLCIIISCLGGGTSSGATPVFAKLSKDSGNLTYGIFTLPFEFEGEKKMKTAFEALEKIKPNLNVYTVIPNERIFEIVDKNTPLKEALSAINKRLADNLEGLIEMIYLSGLINIDFADLSTILSGQGRLAYLNTTDIIDGSQKEEMFKELVSSPIYPYNSKGARGILYNIASGKDIQLSEIAEISKAISESVNKDAKIIFGINQNQKFQNKAKITILAAGCSGKVFTEKQFIDKKHIDKPDYSELTDKIEKKDKELAPKKELESKKIIKNDNISEVKKEKPVLKSAIKDKASRKRKQDKKIVKFAKIKKENKIAKKKKKAAVLLKPKKKKAIIRPVLEKRKPIHYDSGSRIAIRNLDRNLDGGKIRKNALQIRKDIEEAEKEILEQEKIWDVPAILRRKQ